MPGIAETILQLVSQLGLAYVKTHYPELFGAVAVSSENPQGAAVGLNALKKKTGANIVLLGSRGVGKTELSYSLARFLGRPTFAVSPQQTPPSWITLLKLHEVFTKLPRMSTLIMDDLPAYASNRDYREELIQSLEKLIPMIRHEPHPPEQPVGEIDIIFCSQSAAQADKYILDCDMALFKPLGLLAADYERPNIKRIYRDYVDPYFAQATTGGNDPANVDEWVHHHAWLRCREYNGGIYFDKVPGHQGCV